MVWPSGPEAEHEPITGLEVDELVQVGKASVTLPETFVRTPLVSCVILNDLRTFTPV